MEIDWEKCRTFFTLQKIDLNALSLFYGDVNDLDFQIITTTTTTTIIIIIIIIIISVGLIPRAKRKKTHKSITSLICQCLIPYFVSTGQFSHCTQISKLSQSNPRERFSKKISMDHVRKSEIKSYCQNILAYHVP